ncbi:unnamed protein product [Fraxinus pennsylvanica]|uniref:Uncharacterized protein n=1 Tax=Fraxinus pennsylvanica TaxID=56036 RepID=A0AAD2E4G3_9LAMI|nr:unnamed protein product [Fraxinus pennsylvanica]
MLQNQPDFVHQLYSEASTILCLDGNTRETTSAILQIHQLLTSLNYRGIEIKSAKSLESWNEVLVRLQEKGYFVLNDIFPYIDEQILQHPLTYLSQSNFDSKLNASATAQEQVSNYILGGEIQDGGFVAPANIEEHGPVKNYNFPEEQLHQVPESEKILEDNFSLQSNGSLQDAMNSVPVHFYTTIEEPTCYRAPKAYLCFYFEMKSVYVRNVPATMAAFEITEEFRKFGKLTSDGVAIRPRKLCSFGLCPFN